MAVVSGAARDLDAVAAGLARWFADRRGRPVELSPLRANARSGYSSETLMFEVIEAVEAGADERGDGSGRPEPSVVRLPPAGGGLFPEYDLGRQAQLQNWLAERGIPAPAPSVHEADEGWIGCEFLVMPQVPGRIPGDYTYVLKGWLHDAEPALQRACYESYIDLLVALHRLDAVDEPGTFLARPGGTGLAAELDWWREYASWATEDAPSDAGAADVLRDAYAWLADTAPAHDGASVTWGDPRFANAAFDERGAIVGALDWEQAAIGPAELDIGWFLTCRRQVRDAFGVDADPELAGFLDRDATIARFEAGLGRPLVALEWFETFAAIRMGTCVAGIQRTLRRSGQTDHYLMAAPLLPDWVLAELGT